MTDENTRLPSDSVVEAVDPDYHYIDAYRIIRKQASSDASYPALAKAVSKFVADEIAEALAVQPRDDVREASTYERLGQMLRREKLKPTARFLEAAYLGYNLCRMERDGSIALSQGDEQPDTDPWEGNAAREGMMPDTDGLADDERVRFIAAVLEEWDMKPAPDETCGHSYQVIAADILNRCIRTDRKERVQPDTDGLADDMAAMAAALHSLHPVLCEPSEAEASYERATIAFSVLRHRIRALAEGAGK